jgi:hypothetical protein
MNIVMGTFIQTDMVTITQVADFLDSLQSMIALGGEGQRRLPAKPGRDHA